MVETAKIKSGVLNYAQKAILPKMSGARQFVAGMALGLISSSMDNILSSLSDNPTAKMLGLIDGHMIDVDKLYRAAKEQFTRQKALALDIPLIGQMTFYEADLDELYQTICGA